MLITLTALGYLQNILSQYHRWGNSIRSHTTATASAHAASGTSIANTTITTTATGQEHDDHQQLKEDKKAKQKCKIHFGTRFHIKFPNAGSKMNNLNDCAGGETANGINGNAQVIIFNANDKQCCQNIYEDNVKIIASAGKHDHGSSKVKLKNFVDYKWENKNYAGHLIAVHRDGKHIAYVINVSNKATRMEGMIRVVNAGSGLRALIKGMCGEVLDLQFANFEKERLLASIDLSSMYVHKICLIDGSLLCNLIIKVEDPIANYSPKMDKVIWCPFVANDDVDEDDDSQLLVWSRGKNYQCFSVKTIVAEHGTGKVLTSDLSSGYLHFSEESLITYIALSPDGTTLAVACIDGSVRFYQVYMYDQKSHRCLHQWTPHGGRPVSSLFFLDNLNTYVSDTYWKHAITAADNNTEFKVWDCALWKCLQTVKLCTALEPEKTPHFIAEMDRTANYLVVTSLETRAAYILQVVNNTKNAKNDSMDDSVRLLKNITKSSNSTNGSSDSDVFAAPRDLFVGIRSIAEFPLSSGILSFSIVDAAVRRLKCTNDNYLCEELDDYDEETNSIYSVVVHMFVVQSKSMQECHILYQPTVSESAEIKSTLLMDSSIDKSKTSSSSSSPETSSESTNELLPPVKDIKQEPMKSPDANALERIFAAAKAAVSKNSRVASSSAVVAVAAAAAAAPSAVAQDQTEALKSRSGTPQNGGSKSFTGLNLLTPDAFSGANSGNEKNTPENVSSEVLNTIMMLASVTGQAPNLNNMVNNKVIEDHEAQKYKQTLESRKKFIAIDRNPGRNAAENLASGGSSPSREVQEIMSIQDDKFMDELSELIDELPLSPITDEIGDKSGEPNAKWPKAPDMHKVQLPTKSVELQNAANIMSQAVSATSNNNAPPALGSACTSSASLKTSNNNLSNDNSADVADLNVKINQLIDMVRMQSKQINSLHNEITELKQINPLASPKGLSEFAYKLEMPLSKLMQQYLERFDNEYKKKLNAFIQGREIQNREMRENCIQLNQYSVQRFGEIVSKVITVEIQRQLIPMLATKLDGLQQQIQLDLGQKLTTFDLLLKENITQVCKSKHFIDAFGKSVLVGVQNSLQAAFIESMGSTLIPAYEKSSQNMFKQLHDAFSVGIKDFLVQFDAYIQTLQPLQDNSDQMSNKFANFKQQLDGQLAKHRSVITEALLETQKEVKSMEMLIARQVQDTIRAELRKGFDTQSAVLRSQAATPAPSLTYDSKDIIRSYLQQGQINKAFHQALLANDLSLVEFTLRNTDHNAVFTPHCCLEQKVLLSLIQQISADMSNHDETKQNYLSEALLAINSNDPITREHAPKVLQELYRNCQLFLKNYPKSTQLSNVRMLMKGVHMYNNQF